MWAAHGLYGVSPLNGSRNYHSKMPNLQVSALFYPCNMLTASESVFSDGNKLWDKVLRQVYLSVVSHIVSFFSFSNQVAGIKFMKIS